MSEEYLSEEGYALVGAAFEVHSVQGGGLSEEIYQQSLEIELQFQNISFKSKPKLEVRYKEQTLDTYYNPDLLVHDEIVCELKAVNSLDQTHHSQILNYMHISRKPVGYLINFGPMSGVEWKRFILSQYIPDDV